MDKKTRTMIFGVLGLMGVIALAWAWWPDPPPKIDPEIITAAAENSRAAAAKEPAPTEPAVIIKGRAKPGSLGGP